MRSVLVLMVLAAVAHADPRILVMTDEEREGALELTLTAHHAETALAAPPTAELPLERAAEAQRACIAAGAWAAVFVDGGTQVTVVGADGTIRSAPLPLSSSARVFAAIAISLLDELGETPEMPRNLSNVHLGPQATVTADVPAPQPAIPTDMRPMVEAGVAMTVSSIGAQLELTFPLRPHLRIGIAGGISSLFDGIRDLSSGTTAYDGAIEVRYSIGDGPNHFEVGPIGGVFSGLIHSSLDFMGQTEFYDERDTGGWFGARFGYTHALSGGMTVTGAIAPSLMFGFRGEGNDKTPAVFTTLTFGLPI
ncbi:MAG: hypothetical protein QM831_32615 [Kofleriaceae bacterium]